MNFEELQARILEYGQIVLDYVSRAEILYQAGIILLLYFPALFISWRVEPLLEERARQIKGYKGLLRVIVAFLRRLEWLFFVVFLAIAYTLTTVLEWPDGNYLLYSVMLLALAWLLISVFSHTIRSRALGRFFSIAAWVYVAATILGITDDVATLLDNAGFQVNEDAAAI